MVSLVEGRERGWFVSRSARINTLQRRREGAVIVGFFLRGRRSTSVWGISPVQSKGVVSSFAVERGVWVMRLALLAHAIGRARFLSGPCDLASAPSAGKYSHLTAACCTWPASLLVERRSLVEGPISLPPVWHAVQPSPVANV